MKPPGSQKSRQGFREGSLPSRHPHTGEDAGPSSDNPMVKGPPGSLSLQGQDARVELQEVRTETALESAFQTQLSAAGHSRWGHLSGSHLGPLLHWVQWHHTVWVSATLGSGWPASRLKLPLLSKDDKQQTALARPCPTCLRIHGRPTAEPGSSRSPLPEGARK